MAEILDVNVSKCCEGVYEDSLHCDLVECAVFTALVLMEAHGFKARNQLPGFWGNVKLGYLVKRKKKKELQTYPRAIVS